MEIYLYYIILVLLSLLIFANYKTSKKARLFMTLFCSLFLFLIAALRHETVGKDTWNYIGFFERIYYIDWLSIFDYRYEEGYIVLVKFISVITQESQIFIGIVSLLIIAGPTHFIFKYSKNPAFSFILYVCLTFFAFSLSGIRNAIAISIIFFSYDFIVKKKPMKFILVVLFASLFHFTTIIYLIAYPLSRLKLNAKNFMFYFLSFIILLVIKGPLLSFLVNNYFNEYSYTLSKSNSITYLFTMLLVLTAGLYAVNRVIKKNPEAIIQYNLIILAIFIQLFGMESSNIVRVAELFFIVVIIFIPEVLESIKNRGFKVYCYVFVLIIVMIEYTVIFPGGGYGVTPYLFFWQN